MAEAQLNGSQGLVPEIVDEVTIATTTEMESMDVQMQKHVEEKEENKDPENKSQENNEEESDSETLVVNVEGEETLGRFDEFGNFIKNAYDHNFFRNEFQGDVIRQPFAVHLTLKTFDTEKRHAEFDDVYDCFAEIEMNFTKVTSVEKIGIKTFFIDFCDIDSKKLFMSTIARSFSEKYHAWPLVHDSIKITVGSLPLQIKDDMVFKYLRKFAEITDETVIHKTHPKYLTYLNERVYTVNKLNYDLPSYTWICGRQLSIRYRNQPQTCKLCDKKDHKAFSCPLRTVLEKTVLQKVQQTINHDDAANKATGSQHVESYSDRLKRVPAKPVLGGKHIVNGWNQGGYRPAGFRPQWQGRAGGFKLTKPGSNTLGDFMVNNAKSNDKAPQVAQKQNSSTGSSSANRAYRPKLSVKLPSLGYKNRNARNIEHDTVLVDNVDKKIEEIHRIVGDAVFGDEEVVKSKTVHKSLVDLMELCKGDDEEIDFIRQTTQPSAYNIKSTFQKDILMLENCQKRTGTMIGSRIKSPAFAKLMNDYFDKLDHHEEMEKRKKRKNENVVVTPDRTGTGNKQVCENNSNVT